MVILKQAGGDIQSNLLKQSKFCKSRKELKDKSVNSGRVTYLTCIILEHQPGTNHTS